MKILIKGKQSSTYESTCLRHKTKYEVVTRVEYLEEYVFLT